MNAQSCSCTVVTNSNIIVSSSYARDDPSEDVPVLLEGGRGRLEGCGHFRGDGSCLANVAVTVSVSLPNSTFKTTSRLIWTLSST